MSEFKKYFSNRSHIEMRPYEPGEEVRWVDKVHVSPRDGATGSPKLGDFIARTLEKPDEEFLVTAENAKSYVVSNGDGGNAGRVAAAYDELKAARDPDGTGAQVRDPMLAAEAREQAALEAKAEGDSKAAEEAEAPKGEDGTIEGVQKNVETAKPDGEQPQVAVEPPTEEPVKEETKTPEPTKEEPKKEAEKPAVKTPPKFPTKAK